MLFAIGAVSGTVLSFEMGLLWPGLMGTYGDVLGLRGVKEHDESLADDVLDPVEDDETPMFRPRRRRRRNPVGTVVALVVAGILVVTASVYTLGWVGDMLPSFSLGEPDAEDYEGAGTGEILVEIPAGAGGGQIAQILPPQKRKGDLKLLRR